jgi:hypothetical protein
LEFQNGECPWYSALIPREQWSGNLTVRYPRNDISLATPALGVPAPDPETNEYWLVYAGPRDDNPLNCTPCLCRSVREESYQFYTYNPGPNCPGCGNSAPPVDPCNPPVADGYSPVHFRYIWAGQKIFTFFPKKEFMPTWILMRINGNEYICNREADRPWFNCPIPNEEFFEGASWIATDLEHGGDWNTVVERPFPTEPGEYWIRWHYGKPDIGETSEFKAYDYYPDGTNGDWSATGNWNDEACAPRPPPSPISIGYGGWFPYDETGYAYPYGGSLAYAFGDTAAVQDLLNAFVFERYEMWKERFIAYGDDACGSGTARVMTPLAGTVELGQTHGETVSEGQGYGMAMAAAIGDRELFDQLWNFVRHYLSQSAKKYCGGLMGWMWDGTDNCRPIDVPCDPDTEGCGGNRDSAFDGDIDIGIGLVYAARQWPEYTNAAVNWLLKMECEVNTAYDGQWFYATPGDTWDKDCMNYPNQPCTYESGRDGTVNLSYYGPGYFRVFGDFLQAYLDPAYYDAAARQYHRDFWYKTAETVYEMFERCYDNASIDPGLVADWGSYTGPCDSSGDNYNWARSLWRTGIDAAWFGHRTDLPETQPGSSPHYPPKSRLQAKIDNIQAFFNDFHLANPTALNANRFSSICQNLTSSGDVAGCDPAFGHNSYFVNTAMCGYVSVFDNDGATTPQIRREAIEEAVSTTVMNDRYYQESIGVYTMLFLTGNFPNPMDVNSGGP